MELLARAASATGIALSPAQLDLFETYYRELAAWNEKTNLTAIIGYEEVQIKHFLDSLTVTLALPFPVMPGMKLLDVGAGAGFPGLPLKILIPDIRLTMLEATGKKARFLEHMASVMELENAVVLALRAEDAAHLPEHREKYDVVVSRAVAELPSLLELTLPFCRPGGRVIAQKKGDIQLELNKSVRALRILGGRLLEVKEAALPEIPDRRFLVVVEKIMATPKNYPRRSGMPVKRPLI